MDGGAVLNVVSGMLILAGAVFAVIGGIGIVRLPDFYSRIHGAGITDTMGAGLILTGLMFIPPYGLVTVKLVVILVLLWTTGPTATHALANAAHESGFRPYEEAGSGRESSGDSGEEVRA